MNFEPVCQKDKHLPLISIAMCTYNGEVFLDAQLKSIIDQDYANLEIIIVDDCSSDGTLHIIKKYADFDKRIVYFQNEQNIGLTKNFEEAIKRCSGKYIALADQDDIWKHNKISTLYGMVGDNMLVYHDSGMIDDRGQSMNKKMSDVVNFYRGGDPRVFLFFNCVSGHSVLFKNDLRNFLFPFPAFFPYDMWMAFVATNLGTIDFTDEILVKYRLHDTNATDLLRRRQTENEKVKRSIFRRSSTIREQTKLLWAASSFKYNRKCPSEIKRLYELSNKRLRVFFIPSFFFELLKLNDSVFVFLKKPYFSKLNFIFKNIWGLYSKRL